MDESKIRLECGRTPNRGNWVSATYEGFRITFYDDRDKSIPQIKLKEMCLEQLEDVFK
jgi:hypothetical protein